MQEKKVAVATAAPPTEEELNPYTIFPQPEENFKVCSTILLHTSHSCGTHIDQYSLICFFFSSYSKFCSVIF